MKLDAATLQRITDLIAKCSQVTNFDRRGNVYVMDAYVKVSGKSDWAEKIECLTNQQGFQRPEN